MIGLLFIKDDYVHVARMEESGTRDQLLDIYRMASMIVQLRNEPLLKDRFGMMSAKIYTPDQMLKQIDEWFKYSRPRPNGGRG